MQRFFFLVVLLTMLGATAPVAGSAAGTHAGTHAEASTGRFSSTTDAGCKPSLTVNAPQGNFRIATAADAAAIPQANVGDFIVDGKNTSDGIYITTASNFANSPTLGPGKKILIKGGNYTFVHLDIPNVVGSAAEPIIITNYHGQVSTRRMSILGAKHWVLTGRYNPARKTGDSKYLGWESTAGHYQGQFGFDIRNGWQNTTASGLGVGGNATDYEIEYIEVGDGGFAGMLLKSDNSSVDMENVFIHDNYVHDSDGEGIYLGSTQSDPQHQFRNLRISNNVIARAGLNSLQAGQLADNVIIENNVFIMGTINWKSPFGAYQDQGVQFGLRRGGTTFRNNIVVGGSEVLLIAFLYPRAGLASDADAAFIVEDNLLLGGRSKGAGYLESRGDQLTPVILRRNYIGSLNGNYNDVYPKHSFSGSFVWAAYNGITPVLTANDNIYDSSATTPFIRTNGTAQLVQHNNNEGAVPAPRFNNFMELPHDFDYRSVEKWNATIGVGDNKGAAIVYNQGDLVLHNGFLYRSKQNNNTKHQPATSSDSWWELVTFASSGGPCIPDDVRLPADDFYAQQNIGLTHKTNTTPPISAPVGQVICLLSQANGKYVVAESAGSAALRANRSACRSWEQFEVLQHDNGSISLRALVNNRYVAATGSKRDLFAEGQTIGTEDQYMWVAQQADLVCLQSLRTTMYVSAGADGSRNLIADQATCSTGELFRYELVQ